MMNDLMNKAVFAVFEPREDNRNVGELGYYSFNLLEQNPKGETCHNRIYGAAVYHRDRRVIMDWDQGHPPSALAAFTLDIHRAAAANVKRDAPKIKAAVAFYMDDNGKLASSSLASFFETRAPDVIATAPALFAYDDMRLYGAVTGSAPLGRAATPSPVPAPAPLAP